MGRFTYMRLGARWVIDTTGKLSVEADILVFDPYKVVAGGGSPPRFCYVNGCLGYDQEDFQDMNQVTETGNQLAQSDYRRTGPRIRRGSWPPPKSADARVAEQIVQQVAVGVLHEKLAQASLVVTDPIPGVMRRTEQRPLAPARASISG